MEMKDLPDYGDLMPIKGFIEDCHRGFFIDYDGLGYLATETQMSDVPVIPSTIDKIVEMEDYKHFTHVMWFNR